MRKVLVASVAIVTLALAGVLVAAPKLTTNGHRATAAMGLDILEPIQEEWIHEQRFGLVKRLSMMRIIARRTKAATVPA